MSDMKYEIPTVAIVGRPNVGKSTLFNRLLGKRRAITSPVSGVTRDAITERWFLGNHPVNLIDSGGIKGDRDTMDSLVAEKSVALFDRADTILLMMDCTEVTAEDDALIELVRPYTEKVVLVVNKVDTEARRNLVWNFFGYGFQRVVGISAAHGHGIEDLEDTLAGILELSVIDEMPEEEEEIHLVIMGKPNTGKSTLTNLLTGDELSLVSDIAGTTRDVINGRFTYRDTLYRVMDTAGIRRKGKVEEDVEYYSVNRAIKSIDHADVVLLMIDSLEGLSDQDKKIANLITRRGCGVVLVLNKTDLFEVPNQQQAVEDRTRFLFPHLGYAPICFISAKNGDGVGNLLNTVYRVHRQNSRRVDTSTLNAAVREWGAKYQPPRGETGYFKVYYGTQVSANPVKFLFFVNHTKNFPQGYINYLRNCIRRDLGFTMIPVEIDLRERNRAPSLHDRPQKLASLTAIKKSAEAKKHKSAENRGGKAKAKVKRGKAQRPGNKAAIGKAKKRIQKYEANRASKKRG